MRLYVIPAGTLRIDKGAVFTPGIDEGVQIEVPVPVYLIQTDDDENVLVDTGLHPANVDNPYHTWGEYAANVVLPILAPADLLEPRLAEIGLALGDITHVVNTHLHPDHCGANFLFPHADILVQRDQYDEALAHPVSVEPSPPAYRGFSVQTGLLVVECAVGMEPVMEASGRKDPRSRASPSSPWQCVLPAEAKLQSREAAKHVLHVRGPFAVRTAGHHVGQPAGIRAVKGRAEHHVATATLLRRS